MRLPAALAFAIAALQAGGAIAQPATYRLDPSHSFVHFEVLHFGTSTLRGRFGPLDGSVTLDRAAGRGQVGLRIATAAVSSGLAVLDKRLRDPELLSSAAHPEAFFVAEQFSFDGAQLREVRGEVTLRGIGQPLSLRALRFSCRPHPEHGREWCGGDFEAELRRSDFGMTYLLPLVADRVRLLIQVEAIRDP